MFSMTALQFIVLSICVLKLVIPTANNNMTNEAECCEFYLTLQLTVTHFLSHDSAQC